MPHTMKMNKTYETPVADVVDICAEGVLCGSEVGNDGGNGGYLEDNDWGLNI